MRYTVIKSTYDASRPYAVVSPYNNLVIQRYATKASANAMAARRNRTMGL